MQNWNQWQLSAAITSVPQPPVGYAAAGTDPISLMQNCMQYYNQPAPSGYTSEQWATAQQQNWTQWQQWQQQYQQWQAQYGDKYQQTMKHFSVQNMNLAGQMQLPSNVQPPPLPKEDVRPPLPPASTNTYQFANVPPPNQNNLPLFPSKESVINKTLSQANTTNHPVNPPLPTSQPPLPPEVGETRENLSADKCDNNVISESNSAKKLKPEDDDLTEAERTFDEQFQQWEEQFNKWKQQNSNHPDKTQYKQYEAKWTSWREKLIERREQMRKKREQLRQSTKAEADKEKNISGDDKIMNILSNNENQRLINNLLGIGKTLGLTGKQNAPAPLPPPPPPPPPPPETTSASNRPMTQGAQQTLQVNMTGPGVTSWSAQQQWINPQHNPRMESVYASGGTMSLLPPLSDAGPPQMISPNFAQPPPNLQNSIVPNFSQPPPNFSNNDRSHMQNMRSAGPGNMKDRSPFGPADPSSFMNSNDRLPPNFNGQSNFRRNDQERFGRDNSNPNLNEQNQFRPSDAFDSTQRFRRGDRGNFSDFGNNQSKSQSNFHSGNEHFGPANDRFGRENNRFGPMGSDRFPSGNDQFAPNNDRPGPGADRFNKEWFEPENDRFRSGIDRLRMDKDHYGPGSNRFGADNERFGSERFASGGEQFGPGLGIDRFEPKDHFPSGNNDRFGPNNEHLCPKDRFGRSADYFDVKNVTDHRRDSFGANPRGFNRNPSFSPPNELSPELKKLMEKRKAAIDVFKPSFIDSDKSSSVGSLSESFKRITGDSLFKSSFDFQKIAPINRGGLASFSNQGTLSFQQHPPSDLGQVSTSSYSPRNQPFNRDNEPPLRGPPDFTKHPADYNERLGKNMENRPNQSQLTNIQSQAPIEQSKNIETINLDSSSQNDITDVKNAEAPQANEADNTTEQANPVASEDDSRKDDEKKDEENKLPDNDNSLQQDNTKCNDDDPTQTNIEKTDSSGNDNDNFIKKPESLPFMGENDPRPEDLNIEPPPELPNLCPIGDFNPNEDFKDKGPTGNQFDSTFGFTGMEFKPGAPFESQKPPSMFGPRDSSSTFLTHPASSMFQSQGSMDSQRGFVDRSPFGSNTPNEGSRRSNDEQYGGCNDELSGPPSSGKFARRDPMDERFGQFGSRIPDGPIDRQIEPRGTNDLPFAPRNSGPFAPRGNMQLGGLRNINERLDSQMISEGLFGPNDETMGSRMPPSNTFFGTRRLAESQFGLVGPNRFGKANEAPFDKRPLFENSEQAFGLSGERSLDFRRANEGPFGLRSDFNDVPLGSRDQNDSLLQRNLKNLNEARFKSRDSNDGSFGTLDFKARGPISDSSNSTNISPWNDPLNRGDYMRRNSYMRREQLEDNVAVKRLKFDESLKPDEFNTSCPDRIVDVEMRKDGVDEYDRRTFDPYKKALDETASHPRYGANDTWKDKFSSEQRPDGVQQNVDRNVSSMFDERTRSENTAAESKIGDFRPRYGDPATGQDFQSKYTSNLFMKRSQMRPGQEFCVSKQFNYNHGEIDKKPIEPITFTPTKVIDYGHVSRPPVADQHPLPVQCFDYSHGNLKPVVVNREQQQHPKKDFRNWVENEQNLKEYNDKMSKYESLKKYNEKARSYENFATNYDARKVMDYNKRKEHDWQSNDKRSEEERRDSNDRNEREHYSESESRFFERDSGNNQSDRYQCDRSVSKERAQEIHERSRREMNKDSDKDDNRSKGNVNRQENSNKNNVDTKQDTSFSPDIKKNVAETTTKTLELPKLPNHTMVDDLLCPPGRQNRPPKIAIILRGPPGSGKSFVAKLIKDKEVEQGGSAPRILSLDDYFLVEKEVETKDDNGKKVTIKEMVYEYEEAMEQSYITSLVKAFKKNITDGFFNFIILDCINEKISDYEEMWSFAKTKGFKVYICEMEMDFQICLKRNIHNRTEEEINRIIDYFEPTPNYHQKLDVNSMLQEQAIEEVDMEDSQETQEQPIMQNEDSEDSHTDTQDTIGVSKWEKMEAEDKLDRLDGLAKKKHETKPQTMEDFLQVPDYYNMEDTSGKKRVRWADLEERKEQEKMRAVGFVVGHTNWDRMMDPTKGGSALTRTKFFSLP